MRSAAVINNGLRRYVAYSIESVCRVLASMPHCGWFLSNAILIMYTLMYTVFRVLWSEAIVYIPQDRGV